jgi:hypothetical protein
MHIDDYYLTRWQDRNKVRKEKGIKYVGINEVNWDKLNKVIKNFRSKRKYLEVQKIHRFTNSIEIGKVENNKIDILIIEGLFANYLKDNDISIYLKGDYTKTGDFRKERKKEEINKFRKKVLEKEHKDVVMIEKKYPADIRVPFQVTKRGK